jgi:hypothetical protein
MIIPYKGQHSLELTGQYGLPTMADKRDCSGFPVTEYFAGNRR